MTRRRLPGLVLVAGLLVPCAAGAQATPGDQLAATFRQTLDAVARDARGVADASVIDLTNGRRWDVNGPTVFPQMRP